MSKQYKKKCPMCDHPMYKNYLVIAVFNCTYCNYQEEIFDEFNEY